MNPDGEVSKSSGFSLYLFLFVVDVVVDFIFVPFLDLLILAVLHFMFSSI